MDRIFYTEEDPIRFPYAAKYEAAFCKLTLNDGTVVVLEGSGELTQAMVSNQYRNSLVSAEIGELCTGIFDDAFQNCSSLTSVIIPNSVTSIGKYAFIGCSSLTSVTIPNSVTIIDNNAFENCSGLTSVTIPDSVTIIGNDAFRNCSSLTSVTIPNSVEGIYSNTFVSCSSLTSVTIGSGVTFIYNYAFAGCTNLSTITSHIMEAPSVDGGTFASVKSNGILYVPIGSSGYETWMNNQGNLGSYNWTKVEQ